MTMFTTTIELKVRPQKCIRPTNIRSTSSTQKTTRPVAVKLDVIRSTTTAMAATEEPVVITVSIVNLKYCS